MSSPTKASESPSRAFIEQARTYLKDDYLPKIEQCLERLSDEQIWWRANAQSNSIGNLLLHLSGNVRQWIVSGIGGGSDNRVRQQEFDQREIVPRSELLALLKQCLVDVDGVLAVFDETKLLDKYTIQGCQVTALEAIFHVTEHFSMHTGQIIMLTKMFSAEDLEFYDFSTGAPVQAWKEEQP
jgi:uncharacterized damage-inducible protein DinB